MRSVKQNFLKILAIELDDFKEDLEVLINRCHEAHDSGRLSESVFWENVTVFNNEILGADAFHRVIRDINPDEFESLTDLMSDLKGQFRDVVMQHGLVEAINIYVERKMDKVARYVTQ